MYTSDDSLVAAAINEADVMEVANPSPDGVRLMSQLWELVRDVDVRLQVTIRTPVMSFPDVPVRAYLAHKPEVHISGGVQSQLAFNLPEEIVRRIQSRYADQVMARFFGINAGELPEAIVPFYDSKFRPTTLYRNWTSAYTVEDVTHDRPRLKEAIRLTSISRNGYRNGYCVSLLREQPCICLDTVRARVENGRLELTLLGETLNYITGMWERALRKQLGVPRRGD